MRVAIAGASGRMGRMLIEAVLDAPDTELVGALDVVGSPGLGRDAGESLGRPTGVAITASFAEALGMADVLIDFTRPEGTLHHVRECAARHVRMVIGTTGFDDAGHREIEAAAARIGVVFAPNMSVGVNVTFRLLEVAAALLRDGYDIEVIESHHRHKVDAPSGTALGMGRAIAGALGRDLDELATWTRHGITGEREPGTIGFSVVRGGDIVGDHTVLFAGTGERIEITHRSGSRATYAQGALRACRFLATRGAGLFDMQDVLGLRGDTAA
ncbi:MAG: 4-hydroxy-tetrahydrodipicolinate reductase [Burkholderiales bacterium]|nr:MAG: 4-hydroxy-tetrahydrodipicolinate reductase [Burkholderiales bacterium]